jgi:Zn-dependent peptidase ImmA (M78 family)
MEIEEAGPNPERLAAAIHAQLKLKSGPVPVREIAEALDIVEIRERPLIGLEGALVTTRDRNVGAIAVNGKARPERRRFTLAHELGHFLNLWHEPKDPTGAFSCSRSDLGAGWRARPKASGHINQEIQANLFAIELLAPFGLVRPHLYGIPDLEKVLSMSAALAISREAAARRYAELHGLPTALVFSSDGVVRYVERHRDFRASLADRASPFLTFPVRSVTTAFPLMSRPMHGTGWLGPTKLPSSPRPFARRVATRSPSLFSTAVRTRTMSDQQRAQLD